MRILILGGTGVISRYVVKKYRDMGHQVTVINRGNRKELSIEGVEYVTGDANSHKGLQTGMGAHFYDKILDFVTYDKAVMQLKAEVLQKRCRHYVFISSVAVYERKQGGECYTEEMPLGNSKWHYGRKKSECEEVLREAYCGQTDFYYSIIRPGITCSEMFIPYSPIDSYNMPGYLIHSILTGKEILTSNIGEDKMQVAHSADVAENLYALLNCKESRNECFNLSGDEYITSNQILERLSEYLGTQAAACYVPQEEFLGKTDMEPLVRGGWHDTYSNKKVKKVLGGEYGTGKKVIDRLPEAVEFFLRHYGYMKWPETTEAQIRQVIEEAKHKAKAEVKYISTYQGEENGWVALYGMLNFKTHKTELLSEKRRINEECLSRWLQLEMRQLHLVDYFRKRGITQICLYGYGVLGRHVVKALDGTSINILCVIDQGNWDSNQGKDGLSFCKSVTGMEEEYILVSVMSDKWAIINALKKQGCRHIILLDHVLNMLEQEHPFLYPELSKYQRFGNVDNLQVANFGTGMGFYDFCYDGLPVKAFNFSLPKQSLEFDYKLMRHYQDRFLPGCRIYIVLPYCIFLADHIPEIDEINERYYAVLPKSEVESRCNTVFEAYKARQENWEEYRKSVSRVFEAELKEVHEKRIQERQVEELLNEWKTQLGILSYEGGLQRPEWGREIASSKRWLEKILAFCKERFWQPIVVIPPMSRILLDRISPAFRKINFYDILYEVTRESISVLDYSENEEFCNPELYGTPCFLAKRGARRFTRDVLERSGML